MTSTYLAKCFESYLWKSAGGELHLQTLIVSRGYATSAWKILLAKFGQVLVFVIHLQGIPDSFKLFPYL